MINFLAKHLIKDYKNYADTTVRGKYGILCSSFGIFLNILLFIAKLLGGLLASSVAMMADAFNNLSDAASSFISVLGFKLAGKKPDKDHPFGHGRLEYIAGLIVSFLILLMGFELFTSSIDSIRNPKTVDGGIIPLSIMAAGILVKLYMYLYNHAIGKKISSPTMEAVAKDSLSDMISTFVVILSIVFSHFTSLPVDGIGGLIVAVFIFKTGCESAKDTIDPLLGLPPEKEFVDAIEEEVLKFDGIVGIHDLVVHDYGPGRVMISLHAEVPGNRNIFDLHEVIDMAEFTLNQKFNCLTTIHMDPIDTENKRLAALKEIAKEEAQKIDPNCSIHDVRMVPGDKQTNLIFDIIRPHSCQFPEAELKEKLSVSIKKRESDVNCVITVDSPFTE
ncbi:MAG: cation diffusion facilitator family transporter [Treponema sp.]|nr:cation diffusion facilitator family transporter [Treponema sp.]